MKRVKKLILCMALILSMVFSEVMMVSAAETTTVPEVKAESADVAEDTITADSTMEEPTEEPTENPSEEPAENPSEEPAENPSEEPTENPSEKPAENPTEKPAEEPEETPDSEVVGEPAEEPEEDTVKTPTEEKTDKELAKESEEKTKTEDASKTELEVDPSGAVGNLPWVSNFKHVSSTGDTLRFTWTKASGVTGYRIYYWIYGRDQSTKKFKNVGDVSSATVKVPTAGQRYIVAIHAVKKSGSTTIVAESGKVLTNCPTVAPKITSVKCTSFYPSSHSAYFTASKRSSADSYQYEVYNYAGTRLLRATSSTNSFNVTSSKMKAGLFYSIRVRSITKINGADVYSSWSAKNYFSYEPDNVKRGKNVSGGFRISWSAVTGATGYKVYTSSSKDSGYKRIGTTSARLFDVKSVGGQALQKGQRCYTKIIAYKKVGNVTYNSTEMHYYYTVY
ncbi:hypothetical protein [Hespellia stercorisuis]|uniref:Fibronectin type-III domain-containing protein n=1 Tax=Hespellia stercorisuis DSM 15480 TaxID=1121950 RepID=A0A1M6MIE0_9FIRM|nr:hypothetical protein [Hespellia stercorisuis]SHJ83053.1 hypothetical protein SAMN02745243_01497 [Hespellia stercorisuis DSM 15480]